MRSIHFIPAAFDYFGDIQQLAFALTDVLNGCGIATDIFTLQYGAPSPRLKKNAGFSGRKFLGTLHPNEIFSRLAEYDVVHLHCPFLGLAGKLLEWKKHHPEVPLVALYYRDIPPGDFFSSMIRWYNDYYLPKIFAVANHVVYINNSPNQRGLKYLKNSAGGGQGKSVLTSPSGKVKFLSADAVHEIVDLYANFAKQ